MERGCRFCEIANGELEASIFYADDLAVGFLDINPVTPGHALIIPRQHVTGLVDLPEETGKHLWALAHRTAKALRETGLRCEGVNLFVADGAAAFQEVFHLHLHVFPRFVGDTFKIDADWSVRPPRPELDDHARRLKSVLDQSRTRT